MKETTIEELQAKCSHNYPKRMDSWLRWRCCGCGVMKWYWTYNKLRMKRKKLFFGQIEMSSILYNFLYTLLCIFILVHITIALASLSVFLFPDDDSSFLYWVWLTLSAYSIYFVGSKLMSKNNYM